MQPPWRGRQEKYMGRTHHHEDTIQRCSMIAGSFSMVDMMARNFITKSPFSILVRVLTYHKLLNSLLMSHNSNPLFFTMSPTSPLITAVNEITRSSLSLPQGGGHARTWTTMCTSECLFPTLTRGVFICWLSHGNGSTIYSCLLDKDMHISFVRPRCCYVVVAMLFSSCCCNPIIYYTGYIRGTANCNRRFFY